MSRFRDTTIDGNLTVNNELFIKRDDELINIKEYFDEVKENLAKHENSINKIMQLLNTESS